MTNSRPLLRLNPSIRSGLCFSNFQFENLLLSRSKIYCIFEESAWKLKFPMDPQLVGHYRSPINWVCNLSAACTSGLTIRTVPRRSNPRTSISIGWLWFSNLIAFNNDSNNLKKVALWSNETPLRLRRRRQSILYSPSKSFQHFLVRDWSPPFVPKILDLTI